MPTPEATRSPADIESELATLPGITLQDLPPEDDEDDDDGHGFANPDSDDSAALVREAETSASRKGWLPKHLYKGDPKTWVPADVFLERGERFASNLQREVADLRRKLEDFEGTKKAFQKFHEETLARKDAELKEAIAALRVQRSQATAEGDHEGAVALEDRIELLREQQREVKTLPRTPEAIAAAKQQVEESPVVQEWIADGNQWFNDDPQLRDYSLQLAERLTQAGHSGTGRKFLDLVRVKMEEEFPRRFRAMRSAAPAIAVTPGTSSAPAGSRGRTAADLPAEDRKLMRQFVRDGYFKSEQAFLDSYFSGKR